MRFRALKFLGISAVVLTALVAVVAQAPDGPQFEVASIKRSTVLDRGNAGSGFSAGGRYTATNVPGIRLVSIAYGTPLRTLFDYQIVGAPSWLLSERYDINAKLRPDLSGADVSSATRLRYLQSLLEDRFKLVIRHESRQLERYRLVVSRPDGRLGPRLRRAGVDCDVTPGDSRCLLGYSPGRLTFSGASMDRFAADLAGNLDRVVVNETGLPGAFNIDVEWSPDQSSPDKPSIFTAVQEQLGLKLESTKGPVDVLVIDHIEHPTEN